MASFTVIATTSDRVSELVIKDGQLVFVQDKGRIAFDFKGKRTFYNQITELETEYERTSLPSPASGYYFIIETAVLWRYDEEWIQITNPPDDIVYIGTELPSLGQEKKLYVDKVEKQISVWDEATGEYIVVADKTDVDEIIDDIKDDIDVTIDSVTSDDIDALF